MEVFSFENIASVWNQIFWSTENVSPWIIAKYAILGVILYNALILFKDRELLYSVDNGLAIRTMRDQHTIPPWPRLCIWDYFPEGKNSQTIIMGGYVAATAVGILGFGGWIPFALMYLIDTSRIHRNIMCNHAGDTYARLVTLIFAITYVFNPEIANVGTLNWYLENGNMGIDETWSPWGLRMIMALWISCYVNAGIHKLKGPMWRDGTASFYPLFVSGFRRFPVPHFLMRPLWIKIGTWGTIITELGAITAIFPECRPYIVWMIAMMHVVFGYCLNLQLFGAIMISVCTVWIFPETAHNILQSIGW